MSQTLPESMRCPECGDRNGASPNYDSIDKIVYLSCDECGYFVPMTLDEFWDTYKNEDTPTHHTAKACDA